jgi:hypothetical protein
MASVYGFTPDSFKARFTDDELVRLSDDADTEVRNDLVLADVIERVERLFHHHAGRFYVTPMLPIPEGLEEKLLDVLAAKAVEWRRHKWLTSEDLQHARGDYWVRLLERVDKWLEGLSADNRPTKIAGVPEIAQTGGVANGIWAKTGGGMSRQDLLDC